VSDARLRPAPLPVFLAATLVVALLSLVIVMFRGGRA